MKKHYEDMKISRKISIGLFVVAVLGGLIGAVGIIAIINTANCKESVNFSIYLIIALIVISFVIAHLFRRSLTELVGGPIQKFALFAQMLSVGNLDLGEVIDKDKDIWESKKDEVGMLTRAFKDLILSTADHIIKTRAIANGDLTTTIN